MTKFSFVGRLWYYFRIGYGTYLTFLLGALNTLIVVWYLAIQQVPAIQSFFGHFAEFAVLVSVVGIPLSVGVGWAHLKRIPAYSSEMDVSMEANPYNYKLVPGYTGEVTFPLFLELLVQQKRLLEKEGLLTEADRARTEDLEGKVRTLIAGGLVGKPRRSL